VFCRHGVWSVLDLSAAQVRHLGIRQSAYLLVPVPNIAAEPRVPRVKITRLVIDNADSLATNQPITGRVEYEVTGKTAKPLRPCLGYLLLPHKPQLTLVTQETAGITSGKGTLHFRFDSLNKRCTGPMLVFLEMRERSGPKEERTASNMLAAVVMFRHANRTDLRPPAAGPPSARNPRSIGRRP